MRRSRKASVSETLVEVILIIIGLVILIMFLLEQVKDSGFIWVQRSVCDVAVRLRASSITLGLGTELAEYHLGSRCKPIERKIKSEELYSTVTEELESCWDRLGAGKATLISSYSFSWKKTPTSCVVCAHIYPKEGSTKFNTKSLEKYITTTEFKDDKSFLYALQKSTTFTEERITTEEIPLSKEHPLHITYFIYNANTGLLGLDVPGGVVGAVAGVSPGGRVITKAIATKTAARFVGTSVGRVAGFVVSAPITFGVTAGAIVGGVAHKEQPYHGILITTDSDTLASCDRFL